MLNKAKNERKDTQNDGDVNHWQYKGIYFNDEVGENEKNHCEITGAHFKYEEACKKLLSIIEKNKQEEAKDKIMKTNVLSDPKNNKINDIAKVKILLNYNKISNNIGTSSKPVCSNSNIKIKNV